MIIPSIDIIDGQAVQLIGGKEKALDAGDPTVLAEKFSLAGAIAVVDLDAALGQGSNILVIEKLLKRFPCRVGGGIRDLDTAIRWLDIGAQKIVLGTKAVPEILEKLPRERVIAALDAVHGEVVVEGWRTKTGKSIQERMQELHGLVGGFLVTFVEREGRMLGVDFSLVKELVKAAGDARVTIAGGVTTVQDVAEIDRLGADAQVGMALYTGKLSLADAIVAPLIARDASALWPTVVTDERGIALGLTWSNAESVREAVKLSQGVYFSRSRNKLWVKGETSGATQELLRVDLDCDRDALRFIVKQHGSGFCHRETRTCWGDDGGISQLSRRLVAKLGEAEPASYTKRLVSDAQLLGAKLVEEAGELADAMTPEEVVREAADVLYFALVAMAKSKVSLVDVEKELDRRALKVSRRPGDAKGE